MSNEKLLRVLTIFDSSEEAEVLINILRKAGYIVRDIRVEDDEDMEEAGEEYADIVEVPFEQVSYTID